MHSFPRLYAAASLKRHPLREGVVSVAEFSAALCRGLIEARIPFLARDERCVGFSAALCRGLIEATLQRLGVAASAKVFRGFMPRPH